MDWAGYCARDIILGVKDQSVSCAGVGNFSLDVDVSHTSVSGNCIKRCIFIPLLYFSLT